MGRSVVICYIRHALYLIAFYMTLLLPTAFAGEMSLPLSFDLTVNHPSPLTDTHAVARVQATPDVDLTSATITVAVPGDGLHLTGSRTISFAVWPAGETRSFEYPIDLRKDRAMLRVDITVKADRYPVFGMGREIFFLRDAGRYFYARNGFIGAEQARIRDDLKIYRHVPFLYKWLYDNAMQKVTRVTVPAIITPVQ